MKVPRIILAREVTRHGSDVHVKIPLGAEDLVHGVDVRFPDAVTVPSGATLHMEYEVVCAEGQTMTLFGVDSPPGGTWTPAEPE